MPTYAPGWYPDATGRYAQRYYDGAAWTAHVVDAQGNPGSDPVGGTAPSTAPPASLDPTARAAGAATQYGAPPSSPPPSFGAPAAGPGPGPWTGQAPGPSNPAPSPYGPTPYQQPWQAAQGYQPYPSNQSSPPAAVGVTVGLLVVVVGAILALLSLFVLAYWSVGGDGATLGDVADATTAVNGWASGYADVGRYLGLLALIFAVVAVVRLPGFGAARERLPLVAAIAVGVFGLWHLIGLFVGPDDLDVGPAFGGVVGVIGYAAAAAGQFLRAPLGGGGGRAQPI